MKKYIFLGAAMLLLTAACSNDENSNPKEQPTQAVQFSFTNEDFGADETLSRATGAAEAKPQIVDLGDCEAEISVENEPAVKTRGTQTNANGHYTIRAYQSGTLKGEMKGTFSGGNFTPDATSPQEIGLSAGTYDFIAFNDDVIPSGNDLTVARTKAETARMGTTTANITATPQKQKVMFTMKHVGCRLRTQFLCQKHIPNIITNKLEAAAADVVPASIAYNPTTKTYTLTKGVITPSTCNSPASTEARYSASNFGQNYTYTSTSTDYHYFLPGTEAANLKLSFSAGTVFWKPITAAQRLNNFALSMQSNKSYLIKIKLKPNYTYLMSDGTTGYYKDTTFGGAPAATAKTPIAVVVDKDNHIAIALKDTNEGWMEWCTTTYQEMQTNTYMASGNDALNSQATSGYNETWDLAYTHSNVTGNKVKALNPDFLTFKAAVDYNPGTVYTGSPALQWYLPSYSDFKWLFSILGFGDKTIIPQIYQNYSWYGDLVNVAFAQVGGTPIATGSFYWSSSEFSNNFAGIIVLGVPSLGWSEHRKTFLHPVRPFVKY